MTTIAKFCKWTLLIVFAVLILGGVSLWLFFPVEKAKQYAIEKGTSLLEREIEIETASVSFWGGVGIQLNNIVIKNPKGFSDDKLLSAKTLDVKLQIIPLIFGDIAIDRLILKEPNINLYKLQNGQNNFTFKKLEKKAPSEIVKKATPETKAAAAVVTFENIELQDGTLFYQDDSSDTKLSLKGFDLHSMLTHPYDNQYVSSGNLSIDALIIENEMSIPELNLSLKYESQFNPLEKSLTISKANITVNGITTSIAGTVENLFSDISAKINIQSEQADIVNLTKFVPPDKIALIDAYQIDGNLSFDLDLEYSTEKFLYYGTMLLHNVSAAHDELSGKFLCKEALIDIKNNNLRFNIKEGEFDGKPIKGHFTIDDFDNPFINGSFAGSLNLKYLDPFLPSKHKHTISGIADFNLKSSGLISNISNMKFQGELKAENVSYNSTFMLEPVASSTLEIFFDNEIVSIKKISAHTQSGQFTLDGRITSLMQYLLADSTNRSDFNPTIDAKLKGELQLSVLNKILPPKGNPHLSGDLHVDMQLSGSVNDLSLFKPYGKVIVRNGSYSDALLPEKIESFDAQLTVLPDTIIVHNLKAEFETSDANFQGKLIDPFPFLLPIKNINRKNIEKPIFVFTFKSSRFDADKLFPEAVPGVGEESKTASIDSVSTIILPDIDGRGTFSIDTLVYSKMELTSIAGKINIKDKKIECYDVKGNVYSGKIEGNTTIDLTDFNNPHYVGTFNAIQIEVNEFANRFSKFQNIISGKVDMKGSYNAIGWEPDQFLNSLTMNSTSSLRQGKVNLSGDTFAKSKTLFEKFNSTLQKEQTVQNLFTNIIVKDGNVSFDKLSTTLGEIGDLEIDGFYNFDGSISYDGKIKLSKALTKKLTSQNNIIGGLTSLLNKKDTNEPIEIPLKFGGTMDKPEFNLDLSSMVQTSAKGLLDNLIK